MVIAYHLIWTVYGWWLPNDPRGSGSRAIGSDVIAQHGEVHFGRKRVQPPSAELRAFYRRAAPLLSHDLLSLDAPARLAVADAFAEVIALHKYTCYAAAIMPDHVHLLIRKHNHSSEEMIETLKQVSRLRLSTLRIRPENHPHLDWRGRLESFSRHSRRHSPHDPRISKANPLKLGLTARRFPFVKVYDGWPLHPGHSPNSPYAKRLRGEG